MTAEERQMIRDLVNQARRSSIRPRQTCAGCGCDHDTRTAGCSTCRRRTRRSPRIQHAVGQTVGFSHNSQVRLVMAMLARAGVA